MNDIEYFTEFNILVRITNPHKPDFDRDVLPLSKLYELEQLALLRPLYQRILCVPASSAPVERIFPRADCVQIVRSCQNIYWKC